MEKMIEIPAGVKTVTLDLANRHETTTLRAILPLIKDVVALVVVDDFGGVPADVDMYKIMANSGESLLRKLMRSRIVDGKSILDQTPKIDIVESRSTLINGSISCCDEGYIQLRVDMPVHGVEG